MRVTRHLAVAAVALASTLAPAGTAAAIAPPAGSWSPAAVADPLVDFDDGQSVLGTAALGVDRFVVVWRTDSAPRRLVARVLDAAGRAVGPLRTLGAPAPAGFAVAAVPAGGALVVWEGADSDGGGILLARLGADGAPLGPPVLVNVEETWRQLDPTVAARPDGGFLVAWASETAQADPVYGGRRAEIRGRRFDAAGGPVGEEMVLIEHRAIHPVFGPRLVTTVDGFVLNASQGMAARALDAAGAPVGPLVAGDEAWGWLAAIAARPDGGALGGLTLDPHEYTCPSAVGTGCGENPFVAIVPFDSTGAESGPLLGFPSDEAWTADLTVTPNGAVLVAWWASAPVVQWGDFTGGPVGEPLVLATPPFQFGDPATLGVATDGRGDVLVAWVERVGPRHAPQFSLHARVFQVDSDGDGRPDATDGCPATADPDPVDLDGDGRGAVCDCDDQDPQNLALCLGPAGQFRVRAQFRLRDGTTGGARALPLTVDTGAFSYFDPANLELMVKVLDGCALNGRHWVFAAGLTDVATTIEVFDRGSGALLKRYDTPAGTAFEPIQDTDAVPCP